MREHHEHDDDHACGCTTCRSGGACPCGSGHPDPRLDDLLGTWRTMLPPGVSPAYFENFVARIRPALASLDDTPANMVQRLTEHLNSDRIDQALPRYRRWLAEKERAEGFLDATQHQWLEWVICDLAVNGSFILEDFDYTPYVERGGLGKAIKLFGRDRLLQLLRELNEAFSWRLPDAADGVDPVSQLSPGSLAVYKFLRKEQERRGAPSPRDRDQLVESTHSLVRQARPYLPVNSDAEREEYRRFLFQSVLELRFVSLDRATRVAMMLEDLVERAASDPSREPARRPPSASGSGLSTVDALRGRNVELYGPFFDLLGHERSRLGAMSPTEARALGDITVEMVDMIRDRAGSGALWSDAQRQHILTGEIFTFLSDYDLVDFDDLEDLTARVWSLAQASREQLAPEAK